MDVIGKHLRLWASRPFVWGVSDCSIVVADYVLDTTGRDGAAHLRGQYRSKTDCDRKTSYLRRGLVAVVAECAERAGLAPTDDPKRGDIGVIGFTNGLSAAALCLGGGRWAVKSPDGLLTPTNPNVVAAWAVRG